ncbi:hypothetical protein QVD17_35474 [Tagetes erecta]|uniref:E3 ubiquitin-protein ligase PRT1 n=1 Tax=Tagetes erecta TaxID=13708 RepID=A0AAD8K3N4_TARER|nr:hypothetical protein QVD17_35474 [Tagetes erecta]
MTSPANHPAATAAVASADIDEELEQYSEEFKCCVCLELIYKPVVLACGHISCFWCVFEAMDTWQESRCPVCRHSYYHFPSICWLLHFVLLKLYPKAYQIRESQVIEREKDCGSSSPQFENYLAVSHGGEQMASQCHTIVQSEDNSATTAMGIPTSSSDQITVNDLLCSICKELLCRPVVLNCGHVFCEACIVTTNNEPCRCPQCQSMHPNGFPKVCLVLEGFLKQHVSEEYAARIDKLRIRELEDSTLVPQSSQRSSVPLDEHFCSSGHKIHYGVGCDCCGMYPLIGDRYKCLDCTEEIGFDLCEGCHNSSSKLPGRFNQQHKPDHKFAVIDPHRILILSPEDTPEEYEPDSPENQTDVSTAPDMSLAEDYEPGSPENQADVSTAPDMSLDTQQHPEGDVLGPNHANGTTGGN